MKKDKKLPDLEDLPDAENISDIYPEDQEFPDETDDGFHEPEHDTIPEWFRKE